MATTKCTPPLTPAVFHILLALSTGERHGYAIMKQVEADSQGQVTMGPGTLYGSLKRMLDAGLVQESDKRVDPKMDDERRTITRSPAWALKHLQPSSSAISVSSPSRNNGSYSQRHLSMMHEREIVQTLYKRLLTLYPRTFKERLGESMEQTFQDLWNEKRQTKKDCSALCSGRLLKLR
jgi:hypothetical protein